MGANRLSNKETRGLIARLLAAIEDPSNPPTADEREELCDSASRWLEEAEKESAARWDSDVIQFARLIAGMWYSGMPDGNENWDALRENMDLSVEDLDSLFERAIKRWDAAKERV
jgi:hypothetical protein